MLYYTLNSDGSIKEYSDYRFSEDCIETEDNIILDFNDRYIFESETLTEEYQQKLKLFDEKQSFLKQIYDLKLLLKDTDFIVLKISEAETEEEKQALRLRYVNELAERKKWRKRINELEANLEDNK